MTSILFWKFTTSRKYPSEKRRYCT